jgi:hypothetical protein
MTGLVPAVHVFLGGQPARKGVDARDKRDKRRYDARARSDPIEAPYVGKVACRS